MNFQTFHAMVMENKMAHAWKDLIIYCDVDGTLIFPDDQPIDFTVDFLKYAKERGCKLYLWSQGGGDYCLEVANRLGLGNLFEAFLPKPDICVDDLAISAEFIQLHVDPINLQTFFGKNAGAS